MKNSRNHAVVRAAQIVGGISALARKVGVKPPTVHEWKTGASRVPAERCPLIEEATGGVVMVEELRPDISWHVVRRAKFLPKPETYPLPQ